MNELGITEEMVYSDSARSKSDSYAKTGGRNVWTKRYHGSGRRLNPRDRGSSSLFRYDREPSKSPSPHGYNIQPASHMESAASLQSIVTTSIKTEVSESQERLSPGGYSLRSGDSHEGPSSQTSDHSCQSGVKEESCDWSLSQTSHGSRDHVSDRKRTSSDIHSSSSSRICARRYQESDSDDTSSRERDSNRKSKQTMKHDSRSDRYSRRTGEHTSKKTPGAADKNPGCDSKDRDKEERDKNERWKQRHGHTRRISVSPRRNAKDETDNGEQRKVEESYESDGQMANLTKSPIHDRQSLHQMPEQSQTNQEDDIQMTSEVPLYEEGSSQVQPMDLDTSDNGSPEPEKNTEISEPSMAAKQIAQLEHPTKVEQDPDEMESYVDAQLKGVHDTFQLQLQTQYTPPPTLFDFERDETPPAEIVEATAQWYQTQNIPPKFDPVSLQRMIQYYQRSVATSDTKMGNSMWPVTSFHRGGQQPFTMTSVNNCSTPTCGWNGRFLSVTNQCTTNVEPPLNQVSAVANISKEVDDTSFPTVQLGAPSYQVGDPNSSHLPGDDRHSIKFSDSEVQQQLQVFLNKPRSIEDCYYSSEHVSGSLPSDEGETLFSVAESTSRRLSEHIRSKESYYLSMECTTPNTRNNEVAYKNICDTQKGGRSHSTIDGSCISSVVQPELYSQMPGKSRSALSRERISPGVHSHAALKDGTTGTDPRGSLDMWPAPVRSQRREQPKIGEHFREDIWRVDEEWSREHVHKREDVTDTVEQMETSSSRFKGSDQSWGREVISQNRRVNATPLLVDECGFEIHPCLTDCQFQLSYPHKCESESRNSSPPSNKEYPFQDYTSSNKQISHTEGGFSCGLSGEHELCDPSDDDCNVTIVGNESFGFFHNRIVAQSPAPRSQSEHDQFQRILNEELAEGVMEEENARRMIGKTNLEERNTPTVQACSTIAEPSKDLQNTDNNGDTQLRAAGKHEANVHTIPTTRKVHNAHKYKRLQKSYYNVSANPRSVMILAIEEINSHCICSSRNFVSKHQF